MIALSSVRRRRLQPRVRPARKSRRSGGPPVVARLVAVAFLAGIVSLAGPASADPHPLPFSYPYSTLPRGLSELEQYVDMSPVRAVVDGQTGALGTTPRGIFVTELEYGITDRLELGLYLQLSNDVSGVTGQQPMRFDGIKQRLRYRFADAGVWPVNVAVYGEVAELAIEIELEAKVILEKRVGRWHYLANMTAEHEFYYNGRHEWVAIPSGGASFEFTPAFRLGLEYWGHSEFALYEQGEIETFATGWHHYVGPALLFQTSRVWLAAAPYVRLDHIDRSGQVNDQFGRFWLRTIVGIDL